MRCPSPWSTWTSRRSTHGVAAFLGEFPFEAELHPSFELDAEFEQCARATREVLETTLERAWSDSADPDHLVLASLGTGPADLEELAYDLIVTGAPSAAFRADPLDPDRVRPALERLDAALVALEQLVAERASGLSKRSKVHQLREAWADLRREIASTFEPLGSERALAALERLHARIEACYESSKNKLGDWSRVKWTQEEGKAFEGHESELSEAASVLRERMSHLSKIDPRRLSAVCAVLGPALESIYSTLRARGVETFDGLLERTARLLREHPAIAARLRTRLDLLCVDEFQDTDRLQYEIVGELALAGSSNERPALFLVGDPKQSIYGWRNADLAAYATFIERVRAAGGEVHELTVNFRSVPPVLAEVERVLAPAMREEPGIQPAFRPLLACESKQSSRGFDDGTASAVEYWVSWDVDDPEGARESARATEIEATALAAELRRLEASSDFQWRDAALLLRSATDLDVYLAALREAGVPYVVERDRNYYRRREIVEAVAWVNTVLRPHDHLSLVTFLRSCHVGVPDAAWIPLWARGFPALASRLMSPRAEELREVEQLVHEVATEIKGLDGIERVSGWRHALIEALWAIAESRHAWREDSIPRFVARLRGALNLDVTESARFLGAFRAANLDRFYRELVQRLEAERGDFHAVLRALNRDVHRKHEVAEARPKETVEDALRVMTVHMSKGLDFGHVFLGQLHKKTRGAGGNEATWPNTKAAPSSRCRELALTASTASNGATKRSNVPSNSGSCTSRSRAPKSVSSSWEPGATTRDAARRTAKLPCSITSSIGNRRPRRSARWRR